ncbi:hypothetical protein [Clostridium minihomine]|uniref:hypothetical protein n=1 Tax=Clostridium minihomine TaxID=2045012 RepID=UPI000C75D6CD|nr:hypothetical protein [Clostridium minihomine]
MEKLKEMLPFLAAILAAFYLLPLLIQNTGTAMSVLLVMVPLVCLLCAFVYGFRNPTHNSLIYSILVGILFLPSVFIFYNISAWGYAVVYGIFSLIGSVMGTSIAKNKMKKSK